MAGTEEETNQRSQHIPVLLEETLAALDVKPGGVYVDATFGRGGHSRRILGLLGGGGRLIALDKDLMAVEAARNIVDIRFQAVHESFANLTQLLARLHIRYVDGVLLDLGISSSQLDDPQRGFSFRLDGPLDMRMNREQGPTAAEWLNAATESAMAAVIRDYGEERFAREVARGIAAARKARPIGTTGELARIVAGAVRTREAHQHPATRTFQAIRIFINRELEELSAALPQAVEALAPRGRLAVISFHSLEDRIVKRFMRHTSSPPELPRGLALRHADLPAPKMRLVGRAIRPQAAEIAANPRAHSAVLRVAERVSPQ